MFWNVTEKLCIRRKDIASINVENIFYFKPLTKTIVVGVTISKQPEQRQLYFVTVETGKLKLLAALWFVGQLQLTNSDV